MVAAAPKAITCPNCGGSTQLKAAGYTVTLACQYCGSLLDVANPDVAVITAYKQEAEKLEIPLGSRGKLQGTEWDVIGYLRRSDSEMSWDEYLLFNPYAGYRWLSKVEREWSLGAALTTSPKPAGSSVTLAGVSYDQEYEPETVTVDYVLGEFYWRVAVGEQVQASEFYASGKSLSLEQSGSEINWTLNERIHASVIGSAFGLSKMAEQAADEPLDVPSGRASLRIISGLALIASFAVIALSLLFGMQGQALVQTFSVPLEKPTMTVPLGTITINRPYQAVTMQAQATAIDNQWVDLDYSLVERTTQKSINANGVIQSYRGTDSDGAWHEGGNSASTKIASVPRGTYDIMVDAEARNWTGGSSNTNWNADNASAGPPIEVSVKVAPGGTFGSNILLFLLLILGVPLWMLYQRLRDSGAFSSSDDE
jgi:hypothetical protein